MLDKLRRSKKSVNVPSCQQEQEQEHRITLKKNNSKWKSKFLKGQNICFTIEWNVDAMRMSWVYRLRIIVKSSLGVPGHVPKCIPFADKLNFWKSSLRKKSGNSLYTCILGYTYTENLRLSTPFSLRTKRKTSCWMWNWLLKVCESRVSLRCESTWLLALTLLMLLYPIKLMLCCCAALLGSIAK